MLSHFHWSVSFRERCSELWTWINAIPMHSPSMIVEINNNNNDNNNIFYRMCIPKNLKIPVVFRFHHRSQTFKLHSQVSHLNVQVSLSSFALKKECQAIVTWSCQNDKIMSMFSGTIRILDSNETVNEGRPSYAFNVGESYQFVIHIPHKQIIGASQFVLGLSSDTMTTSTTGLNKFYHS